MPFFLEFILAISCQIPAWFIGLTETILKLVFLTSERFGQIMFAEIINHR